MPVRPASSGGTGVRVPLNGLGRRPLLVLIALLVVVGVALAVILPTAFGDDDDKPAGGGATTAVPTAAASATVAPSVTKVEAPPAATPSAVVSSAPSPTPSPSAAAADGALPAGWRMYRDPTGFRVPVPKSWSVSRQGSEVYFREGGNGGRLMIIGQSDEPKADPVKDWQTQEKSRRSGYKNYRRIDIRAVSYFQKAADWEFTYTTPGGNPQRVNKRGFVVSKNQAYGIHWSTSPEDWAANQDELALIYKGFRPAGG
jgi:hypothetical protein